MRVDRVEPFAAGTHFGAVGANNDPKEAKDAGNGLFFRQGYIMAWSGWDPDAPKTHNGMTIKVPVTTDNGKPIVRMIREEMVSGTRGAPACRVDAGAMMCSGVGCQSALDSSTHREIR